MKKVFINIIFISIMNEMVMSSSIKEGESLGRWGKKCPPKC